MNNNLDLTTILKDCPKGTEFYSRCLGIVKFESIDDTLKRIIVKNQREVVSYKEDGVYYYADEDAEIDLFPSKYQRDWSKWHRPFKDGDILSYQNKIYKNRTIYIYKYHSKMNTSYYVALSGCSYSDFLINDGIYCSLDDYNDTARFATEDEKLKLFQAIKDNGYKWNEENKILEKLIVPKFKVGDIVQNKDGYKVRIMEVNIEDEFYGYVSLIANGIGDISFNEQDNWELVPNKFDISTLKPFDKVLVRSNSESNWCAAFFSHIDDLKTFCNKFVTTGGTSYKQIIPYNEETEHLLGTNNQAPEFYILPEFYIY